MLKTIASFLEKLDRQRQLGILKSNANTFVGADIKIGTTDKFVLYENLKKFTVGKAFSIRDAVHILVYDNAVLEIGNNVFLNNFCSVNCLHYIKIGDNTIFGENVKIYDHNHLYKKKKDGLRVSQSDFTMAPVIIGKNCWLGSNVTVLKGVTIGDNSIIGANSLIYKDIPVNSIVKNKSELIIESL